MNTFTLGKGFVSEHLPYPVIQERLPINDRAIALLFEHYKPDAIINCIGKTGAPNIDALENQKTETYNANVVLPLIIAEYCEKHDIRMVHLGSGCIYYGKSPNYYLEQRGDPHYMEDYMGRVDAGWKETDHANPVSFYSRTKYACDLAIGSLKNVCILRLRMPVSPRNHSRNLISKLRQYPKVLDVPNSMTFTDDLVRCIDWVIKENKNGIWHTVNDPPLTAVQIMREWRKYHSEHQFQAIGEEELGQLTVAKRSNCILNADKLRQAGFTMTDSKEALERTMKEYASNV
jgi:3,5-epimerase/4-reductase